MSNEKKEYFWIYINDDGETTFSHYSRSEVEDAVKELAKEAEEGEYNMLEDFINLTGNPCYETAYCSGTAERGHFILIKGECIVPRPVEIIKKYEI